MGRFSEPLAVGFADLGRGGRRPAGAGRRGRPGCAQPPSWPVGSGRRRGGDRPVAAVRGRPAGAAARGRRAPRRGGAAAPRGRRVRRHAGAARRPLHGRSGARPAGDGPGHGAGRGGRRLRVGPRRRPQPAQHLLGGGAGAGPGRRGRGGACRGPASTTWSSCSPRPGWARSSSPSSPSSRRSPPSRSGGRRTPPGSARSGRTSPGLDDGARSRLRERCAEALGPAPFTVRASAWAVRARA